MAIPSAMATKIMDLPKLFSFSLIAPIAAAAVWLTAMPVPIAPRPVTNAAPMNAAAVAMSEVCVPVFVLAEAWPVNMNTVAKIKTAVKEIKFATKVVFARRFLLR